MFEIEIENVKEWKKCIDAIVNLVKEGAFEIDKDEMRLKAMDPSQIAMVNFSIKKDGFAKYTVDSKTKVGINLENLSKILSRSRGKEKMMMKADGNKLNLVFSGEKSQRIFNIPLIDVPSGPSKDLQINYSATVKIKGGALKEILHDVALVSPHILLAADQDKFKVEASGDGGDVEIEYGKGEVETEVKRTTSAVFSQEYLGNIAKGCDDDEGITINLGAPTPEDKRPKPLCVQYKIGNASFTYYLAPRIENE